MRRPHINLAQAATAAVVLLVLFLAIYVSTYLSSQSVVVSLVASWGYLGVAVTGLVSGLSVLIPIPAATLTPVFTAAGLGLPGIIGAIVTGTVIADFIGFLLGSSTRTLVSSRYPRLTTFLETLVHERRSWLVPFVMLYAAFFPFPNEAMLIPLALSGVSFSRLVLPLLIGNTINQIMLVYGVAGLVAWLA